MTACDILSDNVIRLRAVEPDDLDILFKWENDTSIWSAGCSLAPYSRKNIQAYIENYDPDIFKTNQLRMMITLSDSNEVVGTIDLFDFDHLNRRAGVGILIDETYRGNGYASRALDIIAAYAGTFLGMHQLWAIIGTDNELSLSLFKHAGYNICGRMKSWLRRGKSYDDAYILQRFVD